MASAHPALSRYARIILAGPVALALALTIAFLIGFWASNNPTLRVLGNAEQVYNTTLFFPVFLVGLFIVACLVRSIKRVAGIMLAVALICAVPLLNAIKVASDPERAGAAAGAQERRPAR